MKGYTVTFRYTTSIDVFVASGSEKPTEELVETARNAIGGMGAEAYAKELEKNLRADKLQPYTIKKE